MSDRHREPDWSAWNRWCNSRIDARRSFDREVLIELVADLKGMIEDQDEKVKGQAENIRSLEVKLAELRTVNDQRSVEHNLAIAELRRMMSDERARMIDLPIVQQRGLN